MLTPKYLADFRRKTEERWRTIEVKPHLYGFQFQRGTRWNPGMAESQIAEFERTVGFRFGTDLRVFLTEMNGTDLATINVYGSCGEPIRHDVGVYAYPRDIGAVAIRLDRVRQNRDAIVEDLEPQGVRLSDDANLLPLFAHRYVVCSLEPSVSTVLSIVVNDVDAIVYADSLQEYLEREFLHTDYDLGR